MIYFVAILDRSGKMWGARIPDMPGVIGAGSTPAEAIVEVTTALREVAEVVRDDGSLLPTPRELQTVIADPAAEYDPAAGESLVMIPLLVDSGRPVKANISLDAAMLASIDAEARRRGLTRSAFLVSAARDKIANG